MHMIRKLLVPAAAVLFIGLALAQGPRFANAHQPMHAARSGAAVGAGFNRNAGPSELAGALQDVLPTALGLTRDELQALKAEGASIASIAADRGVSLDELEVAYDEARAEAIAELLANGEITEFQAEQMTARGDTAFAAAVEREGCAGGVNAGGQPLYANRTAAARGPSVGSPMAGRMATAPGRPGARARW